jgi:hypothetical protein
LCKKSEWDSLLVTIHDYYASERSIEGYYCAQVFFGMTPKSLYVAGMKTESEIPDSNLDFIRQNGIPSALQYARQIHRDLVIADE